MVEGCSGRPAWSGDAAARRLFAIVREACGGGDDLPVRLGAGLRAALGAVAREPELSSALAVWPLSGDDERTVEKRQEWIERFADLLRDAVADDPRADGGFSFVAPFLMGGVRSQIACLVMRGEADQLPALLPALLESLLAYYFEPAEARRLARAALATGD